MKFLATAPRLHVVGVDDLPVKKETTESGYCWWTTVNFLRLVGRDSKWLLSGLILLAVMLAGLNLTCSYFVRNFSTALEQRQSEVFTIYIALTVGIYFLCSQIAAGSRSIEDSLVLRWRGILTGHLLPLFGRHRARFANSVDGSQHGDQRLTEDIKLYSVRSLSFALIILSSGLSLLGFSAILWSISAKLLAVAFGYAAFGSMFALYRGRPLLPLLNELANAEAMYRYSMIALKNGTGSSSDAAEKWSEVQRIQSETIPINARLTRFTSIYDYLKQIIPIVIVAPAYMHGEIEFGIIGQSLVAFGFVVNAFSIIVKEIESVSFFLAVVSRLGSFWKKLEVLQMASDYTEQS
jgi:putative ATP-binding cassette transporter